MSESVLAEYIQIDGPERLFAVVESLRELIGQELVCQIKADPSASAGPHCAIEVIQPGLPWPSDFIDMMFCEMATGLIFRLKCETYHGTGGSFQIVRMPKNPLPVIPLTVGCYGGMTVNERLLFSGLIGDWDAAVLACDRSRMIAVLSDVELSGQASDIVDRLLAKLK